MIFLIGSKAAQGYANIVEVDRWEAGDLIKLDILVNGSKVDALSTMVHRSRAFNKAKP